jgi:hypothetical protein
MHLPPSATATSTNNPLSNSENATASNPLHLPDRIPSVPVTGPNSLVVPEVFSERHDEMLVEAFAEVQGGFWESVSRRLEEKSGKKYSPFACAQRFRVL